MKIIANSSDVNQGVSQAAGTLSPKGGFGIATMLETLASTEEGKKLLTISEGGKCSRSFR